MCWQVVLERDVGRTVWGSVLFHVCFCISRLCMFVFLNPAALYLHCFLVLLVAFEQEWKEEVKNQDNFIIFKWFSKEKFSVSWCEACLVRITNCLWNLITIVSDESYQKTSLRNDILSLPSSPNTFTLLIYTYLWIVNLFEGFLSSM